MKMRASAALSVVADNPSTAAPSVADRIKRLQAQAKSLAREHIKALEEAIVEVERLAAEVADGGEAYPVGVREVARRLNAECVSSGDTIKALAGRS